MNREAIKSALSDSIPGSALWAKARSGLGIFDYHKLNDNGAGILTASGEFYTDPWIQQFNLLNRIYGSILKKSFVTIIDLAGYGGAIWTAMRGEFDATAFCIGVSTVYKFMSMGYEARHIVHKEI